VRLYVSGPMTGLPEYNYPAFKAASAALERAGYDVLDPSRHEADPALAWEDYLRCDLKDVLECEGVALLDGWWRSRGAKLEVHVAQSLGMICEPYGYWLAVAA
jgi:hypothetical protein